MNEISRIIESKTYRPIGLSKLKPIAPIGGIRQTEANAIVDQAADLISNPDFRPYFFKTLYLIGPEMFYAAMDQARAEKDASCRPCLFVHKLKEFRVRAEIARAAE